MKKIVVYFSKEKETADPFFEFGEKRAVWYDLFQRAETMGLEMYVSSGEKAYLGNYTFKNILKYQKGKFISQNKKVKADAVYDRSTSDFFPTDEISSKVLNGRDFKNLCWDKNLTYELLKNFMPQSIKIHSSRDLFAGLKKFKQNKLVVLKPAKDFGGNGIHIDYPKNLVNIKIKKDYVLQEFVDTSAGIDGIIKNRHDLRIIIINGKIVWAHIRVPKEGSYLANVAQGGFLKEISIEKIPKYVIDIILSIQNKIDTRFDNPIYSIDLGIANHKPYVFEINSHIGFPKKGMQSAEVFIEALIKSLIIRSQR